MGSGLSNRIKAIEEALRRLQGMLKGPPWHRVVLGYDGETVEQTHDRLGTEAWERPSTLVVRLDDSPQVDAATAHDGAGES